MNRDRENAGASRRALRFALRFLAFAGIGLTLYCFPYAPDGTAQQWFSAYLAGYAHAAGFLLSQLESGVAVHGASIAGRTGLEIVKNCDAMEIIVLLGAALLATEGRLRDRAIALGIGVGALVALNLARICSLYYVQTFLPDAFDTIHLELWPPLLVAFATLEFLAWARWLQTRSEQVAHVAR